jgi:hypothetical protein
MLAYVDGSGGASGDMLLAALVDIGYDLTDLERVVVALGLGREVTLSREIVHSDGVVASRLHVDTTERRRRQYGAMRDAIARSGLPDAVLAASTATLDRLAQVEAQLHGVPLAELHLHELSGADTLVDIVGFHAARAALGITAVDASALNVGGGTVTFSHGVFPVPAPATAALLAGVPTYFDREVPVELLTPTAAALLVTTVRRFGPQPAMLVARIGCAVGSRPLPKLRVLRILVGEEAGA